MVEPANLPLPLTNGELIQVALVKTCQNHSKHIIYNENTTYEYIHIFIVKLGVLGFKVGLLVRREATVHPRWPTWAMCLRQRTWRSGSKSGAWIPQTGAKRTRKTWESTGKMLGFKKSWLKDFKEKLLSLSFQEFWIYFGQLLWVQKVPFGFWTILAPRIKHRRKECRC